MALNLRQRVIDRLRNLPETQQTARELAEWIFANFPEECAEKKATSASYIQTDADLVQQLVAEIGSQRPRWQKMHAQLKTTEGRPRRYYWTEMDADAEVAAAEGTAEITQSHAVVAPLREHELYPCWRSTFWARSWVCVPCGSTSDARPTVSAAVPTNGCILI